MILVQPLCFADIKSAKQSYDAKKYKQAFAELMPLAKLGFIEPQHLVAEMFFSGKGTNQDSIQAYAFSKLSESDTNKYHELTAKISQSLSAEQKAKVESLTIDYKEKYVYDKAKYFYSIKDRKTQVFAYNTKKSILVPPKYPVKQIFNEQEGYVSFSYFIYPDGSVRDIFVEEEFPKNTFTKAAVEALSQFNIAYTLDEKEEKLDYPKPAVQKIDFKLRKHGLTKSQLDYAKSLKEKALGGDVFAGLRYAKYYTNVLGYKNDTDQEQINQWIIDAAEKGYLDARYILGRNAYYGIDILSQHQPGVDWIYNAAMHGHAQAQYLAFQLLKRGEVESRFKDDDFYWLNNSVKNGSIPAKLAYIKYIATHKNSTKKQFKKAKKYLKDYAKIMGKIPDWYQAKALLEANKKQYIKALNSISNAIRIAAKAHWDTSELKQQRDLIKQHKKLF
jgi:TPR repeat protein